MLETQAAKIKMPFGLTQEEVAGEDPEEQDYSNLEKVSGIPNFWAIALISNEALLSLCNEPDYPVFNHVSDVQIERTNDPEEGIKKKLSICLKFRENTYFKNDQLKMTIFFKDVR
jgi:hypothetical protein